MKLENLGSYTIDRDSVDGGEGPISREQLDQWQLDYIGSDPLTEGDGYRLGSYHDSETGEVWAADYQEDTRQIQMRKYTNAAAYLADRCSDEEKNNTAEVYLGIE